MVKSRYRQGTYLQYSVVSTKISWLRIDSCEIWKSNTPNIYKTGIQLQQGRYKVIPTHKNMSFNTCFCSLRSGTASTNLQLHLYFSREGIYRFPSKYHHKESTFDVIPSLCPVLRPSDPSFCRSAKWVQLLSGNIRRNFFLRLYISEDNFPTEDRSCSQGYIYWL